MKLQFRWKYAWASLWMFSLSMSVSAKPSFAKSCEMVMQVMNFLDDYSMYAIPRSEIFQASLLETYLATLDTMKLYLQEGHEQSIQEHFSGDAAFASKRGSVCKDIDFVGDVFVTQMSEVSKYLPDLLEEPLLYVNDETLSLTQDLRMLVDADITPWAEDLSELKERWLRYLLFERYKIYRYVYEDYVKITSNFLSEHHKKLSSTAFIYGSFVKALLATVDPNAYWATELLSYPMFRHISLSKQQYAFKQEEMYLPVAYKYSSIFPSFFKITSEKMLKNSTGIGKYYRVSSNDLLLNFIDRSANAGSEYPEVMLLRDGAQEYTYDRSISFPNNGRRNDFVPFQLFSFFVKFYTKHFYRKKLAYMSVGSLDFRGGIKSKQRDSGSMIDILRKRLEMFAQKKDGSVSTLVLDFRGSSITHLEKAISFLSVFLPNKPIFQLAYRAGGEIQTSVISSGEVDYSFSGGLVILVDSNTSFYSEMMVKALQDHGRALVIGEGLGRRTAGRGARLLKEGFSDVDYEFIEKFKVSQGIYYGVTGNPIQEVGVTPDFTLPKERGVYSYPLPKDKNYYPYFEEYLPPIAQDLRPLDAGLIKKLRERSYHRLLLRKYNRWKIGQSVEEMDQERRNRDSRLFMRFEETYGLTKSQLYAEDPRSCKGPLCGSVSLDIDDFSRNMIDADAIIEALEGQFAKYKDRDLAMRFDGHALLLEDSFLYEAMLIAADYDDHLRAKDFGKYVVRGLGGKG